ncbi:MAG: chlorophyll synthesis pathway protein BchC [Chromatiales bacterium]
MITETTAVVFERPGRLSLSEVNLSRPGDGDCVVDIEWSGISTGTERLLWTGRMPEFPGMGYPLIPGYESVGRVASAGAESNRSVGERVFVPGSSGFAEVKGLFGGAAARVVVPGERLLPIDDGLAEQGVLLALAATAFHAIGGCSPRTLPELIVGHGVLGRLLARLVIAQGGAPPTVWERETSRRIADGDYSILRPAEDSRRDYACICDVSGDPAVLDDLIDRLCPGGEVVLAGFYEKPISFAFAPAFMREARLRVAAEWRRDDLDAVIALVRSGRLSLEGLITHRAEAADARAAYRTAFEDSSCLKMVLDWRSIA